MEQNKISTMKEMKLHGSTYREIGKWFGFSPHKIIYWTNDEYRESEKEKNRERMRNQTPKQKKEKYLRQKEHAQIHRKQRYKNDEEFRKRVIGHSNNFNKRKRGKK